MIERNLRASVIRDDGNDEDWGFFDIQLTPSGALVFRCNEATPNGSFDHFLAPGTWREVRDVHFEE